LYFCEGSLSIGMLNDEVLGDKNLEDQIFLMMNTVLSASRKRDSFGLKLKHVLIGRKSLDICFIYNIYIFTCSETPRVICTQLKFAFHRSLKFPEIRRELRSHSGLMLVMLRKRKVRLRFIQNSPFSQYNRTPGQMDHGYRVFSNRVGNAEISYHKVHFNANYTQKEK